MRLARRLLPSLVLLSMLALVALVALATLGGCKSKSKTARAGTETDPWVVGVSQCNLGEPWRVQMNDDLSNAAKSHPNLKLVFKDAQNSSLTQRAQVEELVQQGIDLLIISPKEAAPLTKPVAEAYKKGVPVIVLDRAVEGDEFTSFIGGDNRKIGREAGRWIGKALNGRGKIVELQGLMTSTPAKDRHDGFVEGLKQFPNATAMNLEVVFQVDMAWLEPNARKEMDSALATHPQIDVVFGHNDPGAHGAYLAAKDAGRSGIKFVGIDGLPHEGVQYVKQGILDATFLYPTGGKEAIEMALKILKKESVPKSVTLGTRLYTKDNVDQGGEELP